MNRIILAAACAAVLTTGAFAADLGVISVPAPVGAERASDWTGFYAGIFAGADTATPFRGSTLRP